VARLDQSARPALALVRVGELTLSSAERQNEEERDDQNSSLTPIWP
jgi:hypothetical protein